MQGLLDPPEVGGLAGEGGAVDAAQAGEVGGVVAAEVFEGVCTDLPPAKKNKTTS